MKQENLAVGVHVRREEGTEPDNPGQVLQAAELGGTGHPALGREQGPMARGGCARIVGSLTWILQGCWCRYSSLSQHSPGDPPWVL